MNWELVHSCQGKKCPHVQCPVIPRIQSLSRHCVLHHQEVGVSTQPFIPHSVHVREEYLFPALYPSGGGWRGWECFHFHAWPGFLNLSSLKFSSLNLTKMQWACWLKVFQMGGGRSTWTYIFGFPEAVAHDWPQLSREQELSLLNQQCRGPHW